MGVTKKPAVIAKTSRKVRISRTEAVFAKSQGMSIEELAKSKLPKRGRPVGSKNKPKAGKELAKLGGSLSSKGFPVDQLPVGATITFEELNNGYIDWENLSKRLQEALATEMRLTQQYEKAGFFKRLAFAFTGKI